MPALLISMLMHLFVCSSLSVLFNSYMVSEIPETILYTLSGRIGKVVASHAAVARSSPADVALIYTMHVALRGYCP